MIGAWKAAKELKNKFSKMNGNESQPPTPTPSKSLIQDGEQIKTK
jgi:hypothetical protein